MKIIVSTIIFPSETMSLFRGAAIFLIVVGVIFVGIGGKK